MTTAPALHVAGYRVIDTNRDLLDNPSIGLAIQVVNAMGQVVAESDEMFTWVHTGPEALATRNRYRLLLEAICRFLNFPTNAPSAADANDNLDQVVVRIADLFNQLPKISISNEWTLWTSEIDATVEHVYRNKQNNTFLHVVEGEYSEILSEASYLCLQSGLPPELLDGPSAEEDSDTELSDDQC